MDFRNFEARAAASQRSRDFLLLLPSKHTSRYVDSNGLYTPPDWRFHQPPSKRRPALRVGLLSGTSPGVHIAIAGFGEDSLGGDASCFDTRRKVQLGDSFDAGPPRPRNGGPRGRTPARLPKKPAARSHQPRSRMGIRVEPVKGEPVIKGLMKADLIRRERLKEDSVEGKLMVREPMKGEKQVWRL